MRPLNQQFEVMDAQANKPFIPIPIPQGYIASMIWALTTSFRGNTCHVMAEVLLSLYDLVISHGMVTHIATNLNPEKL